MALFKTKKKRYVDTQILRVIEDEDLPTPLRTAMFEAILGKDGNLGNSVKNAALNGPGRNFEKMYRYAERGDYIFGLPDARLLSSDEAASVARNKLEADLSGLRRVNIEYVNFSPMNNNHMAWKHLHENLGYNSDTNEIESLTPEAETEEAREPRYLKNIVAVHKGSPDDKIDPQSVGVWGKDSATRVAYAPTILQGEPNTTIEDVNPSTNNTPFNYDYRVGPDELESAEIHFSWEEKEITYNENGSINNIQRTVHEDFIVVDLSDFDMDKELYQAKYSYDEQLTRPEIMAGRVPRTIREFWTYEPGEGTYPELDGVYDLPDHPPAGTYFPFAIFRSDHQDMTQDDGSQQFKDTKKLLDYINIDFEEVGRAMHDEENEDVDDIRQAVMMMAVPLNSDHEIEMDYLFEYFKRVSQQILDEDPTANRKSVDEMLGRTGGAKETSYALEIGDSDFHMVLSFDSVKREFITTTNDIGPVGSHSNEVAENEEGLVFDSEDKSTLLIPKIRTIKRQIIASHNGRPGVIEQIVIENPVFKSTVKRLRKKDLIVEGGVDDDRILIPLDRELVRKISTFDREILYFRSLHFVLNTYVEIKVKWWQTGIFKAILVVIAVVVAWFTGQWQVAFAMASTGAAAAMVILKFVITILFEMYALQYAFQFVVEQVGIEIAFWIAVAATLVGGTKAISNAIQGVDAISQTVINYLKVASGLTSGIGKNIEEGMENLRLEQQAFAEEAEEKMEELEELSRELISPVDIDPLYFVRRSEPFVLFGEPAAAYFERTAHSGNVGVKSLDTITNYVDYALTLPTTPNFGA